MSLRERSFTRADRMVGLLGHRSSSVTLVWLASHRDRLTTFILGGRHLSLLLIWDKEGNKLLDHDQDEVDAMTRVVYGPSH